jgi:hypothetical protein
MDARRAKGKKRTQANKEQARQAENSGQADENRTRNRQQVEDGVTRTEPPSKQHGRAQQPHTQD